MIYRMVVAFFIIPLTASIVFLPRSHHKNAIIRSIPRGGSNKVPRAKGKKSDVSDTIEISNEKKSRLQNVIRSLMEITQRKSPTLNKVFKHVFKYMESVTGMTLLPKSSTATSTSSKKSKKKKKSKSSPKEEEEEQSSSSKILKSLDSSSKKTSANTRIQTEIRKFLSSPTPNLKLKVGRNIRVWIVTMTFPETSIYHNEKHRLRISFPQGYPAEPPSVFFLQPPPQHEHVYTNGDICLSLLGKDWRPTMTAQSIALSIASILNGAREKSLPMDNAKHCGNKPGQKQDDWVYHDDNC